MNATMHPDPPRTTGDEAIAPDHIMPPVAQDMVMPDEAWRQIHARSRPEAPHGIVVLENENGVQIRSDDMDGRHHKAHNAICECGESLIVAPPVYHPDHRIGDPIMICGDFGVHAYRFQNLVRGRQPTGTAT